MTVARYVHNLLAVKHYGWDWTTYCKGPDPLTNPLPRNLTISSWTADPGVILGGINGDPPNGGSFSNTALLPDGTTGIATAVWVSIDPTKVTVGDELNVTNHVTLSDGTQPDPRTFTLIIEPT